MYVLSRQQQNVANQIKRMEERTKRRCDALWESKSSEYERRWKAKLATMEKELSETEKERDGFRVKYVAVKKERDALKNKINEMEKEALKVELDFVKSENVRLTSELVRLESEVARLKCLLSHVTCNDHSM